MKLAWVAIASLALASTANAATYGISSVTGGGSIVAGTVDTGNHCDDCDTSVLLPFSYTFFGTLFTAGSSINVSSNGNLQFTGSNSSFANTALPAAGFGATIFGFWGDLRTDNGQGACQGACGIFTSISGSGSSQIFNIEWVTNYFGATGSQAVFEIRLFQGLQRFQIIYGSTADLGAGETIGVQDSTGTDFTQFSFDTASVSSGMVVTYDAGLHPPVPEPTSASLLLLGGGLLIAAGRLRKRVRG